MMHFGEMRQDGGGGGSGGWGGGGGAAKLSASDKNATTVEYFTLV